MIFPLFCIQFCFVVFLRDDWEDDEDDVDEEEEDDDDEEDSDQENGPGLKELVGDDIADEDDSDGDDFSEGYYA